MLPIPTSHGGTITPQPTQTPIVVPTIPQPATPTRPPSAILPTLSFPSLSTPSFDNMVISTVQFPEIAIPTASEFGTPIPFDMMVTPNGTAEVRATQIAEWGDSSGLVLTRWYTTTGYSTGAFSTTITGTAGVSSVVEIAGFMGGAVAAPFGYVRLIQAYLPTVWPLVLFLLIAAGWVVFNLVAKYGIAIIATIIEWIRRLIELIPGF